MRIFVIERKITTRATLISRLEEALRQAGLKHVQLVELDLPGLPFQVNKGAPGLAFLGPSYYEDLEESISRFRSLFPSSPLGVILDNEVYAAEAVELRRTISARLMPIADIAQMAQLVLDSMSQSDATATAQSRGVVMTAQLKGGVGASTVAAGLAGCWARHELSVVLVDLDDVNPQLTDWGRAGTAQRNLIAEFLRAGKVPSHRINELLTPVEGYENSLFVCGQPEHYGQSFHYKADVLPGAPSAASFIDSLLGLLSDQFDVVVIDSGRSWGIATFAALPYCQSVLLVTDDDGISLRRTLDNFCRMYRESDDPAEFDLAKWSILFNAYTGKLLQPADITSEVEDLDLFPESMNLFTIPFSEHGRQWGAPGETFYDLAEEPVKETMREIAFNLIPFRYEQGAHPLYEKLRRGLQKIVQP
jgi:cellulose biosynthesis protein BcsQ